MIQIKWYTGIYCPFEITTTMVTISMSMIIAENEVKQEIQLQWTPDI